MYSHSLHEHARDTAHVLLKHAEMSSWLVLYWVPPGRELQVLTASCPGRCCCQRRNDLRWQRNLEKDLKSAVLARRRNQMQTKQQDQLLCKLRFTLFCQVPKLYPHQVIVKMYYLVRHVEKKEQSKETKIFKIQLYFSSKCSKCLFLGLGHGACPGSRTGHFVLSQP